ncbi:MAG: aldo/keto reductase [Oscillospiraceae bacterium]|nr:aldo/keto reductase [Oscillospiraceae bacterium]
MSTNNLKMPKIALGAWAWGNDGTFGGTLTESELRPVFDEAMKKGLYLWDTAFVYGMGTSETVLGNFLKSIPRDQYLISTKFTPQCADPNAENAVTAMYEGGVQRLGTDFMDIYWIHNPVGAPKWITELIPLAKSGKIGKIGVSNHNLAELKQAEEILAKEGLHISAVQNHYSLLNRSSETSGILDYCKEKGIVFFSYMVLEQGALSGKYDKDRPFPEGSDRAKAYNSALGKLDELLECMKNIANAHNVGIAQVPVAWAVAKGTLPIIGVTKTSHVEDAVKAAELVLSASELENIESCAKRADIDVIRMWEKEMK